MEIVNEEKSEKRIIINENLSISLESAKMSGVLKQLIEMDENNEGDISIPLLKTNIDYKKIFEYCECHKDDKPLKFSINDTIIDWDKNYFNNLEDEQLIQIYIGVDYLDIPYFLELCAYHIALRTIEKESSSDVILNN